jgi:hypothetical protein
MKIEDAIEKAIEGGYNKTQLVGKAVIEKNVWGIEEKFGRTWEEEKTDAIFLLAPSFWQSFGEAMGWRENEMLLQWANDNVPIGDTHWLYQWHRFIDHLAEGNTAKSFFETLR